MTALKALNTLFRCFTAASGRFRNVLAGAEAPGRGGYTASASPTGASSARSTRSTRVMLISCHGSVEQACCWPAGAGIGALQATRHLACSLRTRPSPPPQPEPRHRLAHPSSHARVVCASTARTAAAAVKWLRVAAPADAGLLSACVAVRTTHAPLACAGAAAPGGGVMVWGPRPSAQKHVHLLCVLTEWPRFAWCGFRQRAADSCVVKRPRARRATVAPQSAGPALPAVSATR